MESSKPPTKFGQSALVSLPPLYSSDSPSVALFNTSLQSEEDDFLSKTKPVGIEVFKVSKNGKIQPRRIALTRENHSILVTSNKLKSIKGLFKAAFKPNKSEETTSRSIDISSVIRIERGQYSNRFLSAKAQNTQDKLPNRNENNNKVIDEGASRSISIVYRIPTSAAAESLVPTGTFRPHRGPHRWDTLDFVVPNENDYDNLLTTLEEIKFLYEEERKWQEPESRFWKFQWSDMGKLPTQTLSSSEWITFCEKMNFPLKKSLLNSYYKEYSEEKGKGEDGLTLEETVNLLTEVKSVIEDERSRSRNDGNNDELTGDPILGLWNHLLKSDPIPPIKYESKTPEDLELQVNADEESISAIAFLSFIRSEQKEYTATLGDAQNLIQKINSQEAVAEDEKTNTSSDENSQATLRLSKSRFISFLASDVNDLLDSSKCDEMHHPITDYWINSSHDTFLGKLPNSLQSFKQGIEYDKHGSVEFQSYIQALHRGVRCLEVDVYDGIYGEPVVTRRKPMSPSDNHSIPFAQVLESIRSFLHQYPDSFPIILCLEDHCSSSNQMKMAKMIDNIFNSEGLLHIPPNDILKTGSIEVIPSPRDLKGKIIIKNKRPKVIRKGATVVNDDFDEDNDLPLTENEKLIAVNIDGEDEDEIEKRNGFVVGFDVSGPLRSKNTSKRKALRDLYSAAEAEALDAKQEALRAKDYEQKVKEEEEIAERYAQSLIKEVGFTAEELKARIQDLEGPKDESANNIDEITSIDSLGFPESNKESEGLEVQDFFANTVEGAKVEHSEANNDVVIAAAVTSRASQRLKEAIGKVEDAKESLEDSRRLEKAKATKAERAASDARINREHADTAKQRVETVKKLLRNSKESAASAETVVVTAMTEAKISEQRASETEGRASRALNTAVKERARADKETKKEEVLENEAALLHEKCVEANRDSKTARSRLEKCASMLDRVNEQIKLIEGSAQFLKELKEFQDGPSGSDTFAGPRHGSSFLSKHNSKIQERDACTKLIEEASIANTSAEARRKRIQTNFEEKAHSWKVQSDIASQARKQADRSSHHAEELAELAEEEREAASLRHIAREKAQMSVSNTDDYQSSIEAQLAEASRASEEAASLALESRMTAERLAREVESVDHSEFIEELAKMEILKNEADCTYQEALKKQKEAEAKANDTKRLLDTTSEVLTKAKRDAAEEEEEMNERRKAEDVAIEAYRKFLNARNLVNAASVQTKSRSQKAEDKEKAKMRAFEYKFKMESIGSSVVELASLTYYNSTKFKAWEESLNSPNSSMHSISEPRVKQMLGQDEGVNRENFMQFTKKHICRIFPSWRTVRQNKRVNYDPVIVHALGCQLASMNFHSCDENLILNDGRFRSNGSSGYALKPPHLRGLSHSDQPQKWRLNILRGFHLPKGEKSILKKNISMGNLSVGGAYLPGVSPFVRISMHEGKLGAKTLIHETKAVRRNGFSPVWNEENDEFEINVEQPSIALLSFTVWDKDTSDFIAGAAVPVDRIRQGYRSIVLFDSIHSRMGPYASASLVVRAQKL